jgi:hypothetical protein
VAASHYAQQKTSHPGKHQGSRVCVCVCHQCVCLSTYVNVGCHCAFACVWLFSCVHVWNTLKHAHLCGRNSRTYVPFVVN